MPREPQQRYPYIQCPRCGRLMTLTRDGTQRVYTCPDEDHCRVELLADEHTLRPIGQRIAVSPELRMVRDKTVELLTRLWMTGADNPTDTYAWIAKILKTNEAHELHVERFSMWECLAIQSEAMLRIEHHEYVKRSSRERQRQTSFRTAVESEMLFDTVPIMAGIDDEPITNVTFNSVRERLIDRDRELGQRINRIWREMHPDATPFSTRHPRTSPGGEA